MSEYNLKQLTRKTFALPTGKTTHSAQRYVRAWRRLARPIGKFTKSYEVAYDPGIEFSRLGGGYWNLATPEALLFYELISGKPFDDK